MKRYSTKFKSFLWKIVQMGTLQKLQNSIQTLIIFLACLLNQYKLSILGYLWSYHFAIFLLQILLFVLKTLKYS